MRRPGGIPIMRLAAGLSKWSIDFPSSWDCSHTLREEEEAGGVWGGGVGEGHRQVMLLLTLTDGEWHFVFTRRPCERSSASDGYIRDETDFPSRATFHSKTDTGIRTCIGSLILCTQRCLTPEKSVSYIVKIFFLIFFYCCPPLIHNLSSPERDLNTRERF